MKRAFLSGVFAFVLLAVSPAAEKSFSPVDYVNPFIGTTNFGTTHPGAVCPNGMMSVDPFNVMGAADNKYDKDARWWSTPYEYHNCFFTGYSHVNLSGVGCPELGSLLLMPTTGELSVDYKEYGSRYEDEQASPGYYTNFLTRYNVKTEVTATPRTGVARFTFPKGRSHILLNLGEGLTNETGAFLRQTGECEFEGMKLLGTFCYNPQAVFPVYFVMRVNKTPLKTGYWKKQRSMTGVEAEWDPDNGKYKLYTGYRKELAGDDIGAFLTFDTGESEQIEVQMGVSFVSIENARLNLDKEQSGKDFDKVLAESRKRWHDDLSRIIVEGGTDEQKIVFYTALYHALIHPNLLQKYFKNAPDGIPGNDDTGTMSAWAIFNMMGFYPDCPGEPSYTLSTPVFDKVTIRLDAEVWGRGQLVIETERPSDDSLYIREMELGGKRLSRFRISHQELVEGGKLRFVLR